MKVYVVIVTYNGIKWLEKCLNSVLNSSIHLQIVLIDNHSSDATVSFIKENYPEIILLEQKTNLGFGAANNIGINYALKNEADYLFLLNQDAYLQKNTIEKLIEVSNKNQEFGILSPIHLNGLGNNFDLNFLNYIQKNTNFIFDGFKNDYSKVAYEIPFVNAAAWLLPKATLEYVGGFDPMFFHYGEDDNFCQRILFHELKIAVVPKTYIYHDREVRVEVKLLSNKNKLILRERFLKSKWGNINHNFPDDIKKQQNRLIYLAFKLMVRFQFKKMKYYFNEYLLVKRIIPIIIRSRKINSQKGPSYLSTKFI